MRRGDRAGWILAELGAELRVGESAPEVVYGLPNGHVEEHAATGDATMQLGGDVARLALEVAGIVDPGGEELIDLLSVDVEFVHQNHPPAGVLELAGQCHCAIYLGQLHHSAVWQRRQPASA